jgi:thiosulfate/3-mercaptopyruvate sulfurtransferase
VTTVLLALILSADPAAVSYARPELLIEPTDPALLTGKKYVVLDVRDKASYEKGHIPGALWIPVRDWAKEFAVAPSIEAWSQRLGALGIGPDTPVVVCDAGGVQDGSRVWWILRYWGVKDVRLLNGGWKEWTVAGNKTDREEGKPKPIEARLTAEPGRLATRGELLSAIGSGKVGQIIDTRSSDEFCGVAKTAKRNGTIPNAKHVEWKKVFDARGRVRPAGELAKLFRDAGIDLGKPATTFCQSGGRASVMAFALELMGDREVRNYYRSWAEWGNDEKTPVVKPESKE